MNDKMEQVKKILDECVDDYYRESHPIDTIAHQIDALYSQPEKPKAEDIAKFTESVKGNSHDYQSFLSQNISQPEKIQYTLNCTLCGEPYYSVWAFPNPQLCPKCRPASTEMLLTDEEIQAMTGHDTEFEPSDNQVSYSLNSVRAVAKAQLAKCQKSEDAIRAEYEAKIKELEKKQCVELDNCLDMKSAEATFRADQQAKTRREIGGYLYTSMPVGEVDAFKLIKWIKLIIESLQEGQSPKQEGKDAFCN
jgi:hypothetical protein